jgi:hypothetical protein
MSSMMPRTPASPERAARRVATTNQGEGFAKAVEHCILP